MADVMDMPPEPILRERRDSKGDDIRRDSKDDNRYRRDRRRKSSSPHRRHSPPSRRSPGGHKRSRRDDDRFDSRDGILGRGGGGSYGWDYGGRNRDWQGRNSYGDGGYAPRRDGLMTYKQFIGELEDDILPAEAERRYEEYKAEYVATQKRNYFDLHKEEDWLKDKYDPSRLEAVVTRRTEVAKSSARDFQSELQAGTLDMGPAVVAARSMFKDLDAMSDDEKRKRNSRGTIDPPRAPPVASDPKRISKDIEQARALIKKLDSEKGIEENVLSAEQGLTDSGPVVIVRGPNNQVKGLEGMELLDVMLTYLWRVHGLDYYGMIELRETPRGVRHVRADGKSGEENGAAAAAPADWETKLDSTWQSRLQGHDPVEAMLGRDKLEASMNDALEPLVRKIKDEKYGWKYGCGAKGCTKLFHGPEFVHKHLKLKHMDLVNDSISKVREQLYFQNYMSDPNAPGVAVAVPGQVDNSRVQKRRPLHGNSERLGPPVAPGDSKSPGRDFGGRASSYEAAGPSSSEQAVFDPYGPGIHGFGSELPPPVLMPVPGAGPLGPFVPAPPDVTMRMWREHGQPQPFQYEAAAPGFDSDRGRKGRGVLETPQPPTGGRQDPRAMRSYHDLDAPEDEITVIDYRSL